MFTINTNPVWIVVIAIIAIVITGVLYFRNNNGVFGKWTKIVLATLRFLALFLILLLLTEVFFTKNIVTTTQPTIFCAVDNSTSMLLNKDSAEVKQYFENGFPNFKEFLNHNFTAQTVLFGDEIAEKDTILFDNNATDIASVFDYLGKMYSPGDIGAAVIFTDGIYTNGISTSAVAQNLTYPVYFVGTGDTTSKADMSISNVRYNKVTYLKSKAVFEVSFKANNFKNRDAVVQVFDNNKLTFSKNINITVNPFYTTFKIELEPQSAGKHNYRIAIPEDENDIIPENNEKNCIVNVIEGKKNVNIIANGTHPDVAAMVKALATNENVEVKVHTFDNFDIANIKNEDIFVLYNLPDASSKSKLLIDKINHENAPFMLALGNKTNITAFNTLINGMKITDANGSHEEAYPAYNETFNSFTISEALQNDFNVYTPLTSPFGLYEIPANADILAYQRIGNTLTDRPLIITLKDNNRRSAIVFGQNIWQWRIRTFLANDNFDTFDELVDNMIYYLSLSEVFKHFQIDIDDEYYTNERITIGGRLYNNNFELFNTPDIRFTLKNEHGNEYPYYMNKGDDMTYTLDVGTLPKGQYSWTASSPEETLTGSFYISAFDPEHVDLQARHREMTSVAQATGGKFFFLSQSDELQEVLKTKIVDNKTYTYKSNTNLRDILPLLLLIVALLTSEWVIRRHFGTY